MISRRNTKVPCQGFTLIEVIAVLVLLALLASVALPKYNDLQQQAALRGASGIMAGALSQSSLAYSENVMGSMGAPDLGVIAAECENTAVTGDYTITCTPSGNNILITVEHTSINASLTELWISPAD